MIFTTECSSQSVDFRNSNAQCHTSFILVKCTCHFFFYTWRFFLPLILVYYSINLFLKRSSTFFYFTPFNHPHFFLFDIILSSTFSYCISLVTLLFFLHSFSHLHVLHLVIPHDQTVFQSSSSLSHDISWISPALAPRSLHWT